MLIIRTDLLFLFSVHVLLVVSMSQNIALKKQPHVVVIGAGASGIAAASELVRNGFLNVKILEAENRIGGRVCTKHLFGETLIDLGAEFYEGLKKDAVWEYTKPYHDKLLDHPSEDFKLFNANNGGVVEESMRQNLFKFLNEFQEDSSCDHIKSVGECFEKKYESLINSTQDSVYSDFLKRSKNWAKTMLHLFSMSPDLYQWGLGTHPTKGPLWSWKNLGYQVVLDIMMGIWPDPTKSIFNDDQKLLNKEVSKISDWKEDSNKKIKIYCADNSVYEADHVICTISLGVLKASQSTLFEPDLPESKKEAINKSGFGPLLKIILHFKDDVNISGSVGVVWEPQELSSIKNGKNLQWLQALSFIIRAENNPKVLICFYTGPIVETIESLSDDVLMEGQKYLADKVLRPQKIVKDYPDQIVRTSWLSNPHFRGVNSYKTVHGDFQKDLAAPIPSDSNPRVLFAGEATHPEYYTTVHGAVETGLREARRLIELYRVK